MAESDVREAHLYNICYLTLPQNTLNLKNLRCIIQNGPNTKLKVFSRQNVGMLFRKYGFYSNKKMLKKHKKIQFYV